ncbi:TPA: HAD-IC family P-type ATPase [Candidatus Ventrenecus stercoripullorum]|nr:HAD-IC family P-type ATPase [Candidatus Ventrenecus stercoripullorum]
MFYKKETEEVLQELHTSENGLNNNEVQKRKEKYGRNDLPKKKRETVWHIFFNEFKDPIVILLMVAILASFIVGEVMDAVAILFIVLLDACMGTYQENKANKTAEALANLVKTKVAVIRNGKTNSVDAEEVTIGDIVLLESGDKVSADIRLLETYNLKINESVLTGESTEVHKIAEALLDEELTISDQKNMAFSGTTVVRGRAKGVIVGIGLNTELGKIADSMNQTEDEKSPLTIRVEKLSKQISILVLIIAVLIATLLIIKDVPYDEIFLSVIALAVSAMPEGLPLALTMALTIASNKMAKKNVIVRKLNAAESLGSCTVIASDKTGTLTINEQTAKKIIFPDDREYIVDESGIVGEEKLDTSSKKDIAGLAFLGGINNEASIEDGKKEGDAIDVAFLIFAKKLNVTLTDAKIITMLPYESENKYSAVFYEQDGETYATVKGSLETVCSFCDKVDEKNLNKQNEALAKAGFRMIALASGRVPKKNEYTASDLKNLTYKGMLAFIDPIRKEAISSIKECREAGIKVLMITGDHPLTALSIAKDIGLATKESEVTTGLEIESEFAKGEKSFDKFIKQKRVFARVTPIEKLHIVESLKRQGEFVAVTGDGVNDAPALKAANIGVAMGSGTDIARETADMIIVDDNFTSIVAGVMEGRIAYANIRKIIYFLISCGVAEVVFFLISILLNLPMPLVAIQLLWLNVVTDGIQDFALSFEKGTKDILKQPPIKPQESIFNKTLLQEILVAGGIIGIIVLIVWYYLIDVVAMDTEMARGYTMCLMVFIQNIHVFNCRSEDKSAFKVPLKNNWLIVGGVVCSIILQIIVMEVPFLSQFLQTTSIPFSNLVYLFLIACSILVLVEIYKRINHSVKNAKA